MLEIGDVGYLPIIYIFFYFLVGQMSVYGFFDLVYIVVLKHQNLFKISPFVKFRNINIFEL